MAQHDLRDWLAMADEFGDIRRVDGAGVNLEIGALVDIAMENPGRPALLFDRIPGFAPGRRVLGNVMVSERRVAITSGLDPATPTLEIVRAWRDRLNLGVQIPFREVETGPVLQNVQHGEECRLTSFPAPKWHELDGGHYIGTGSLVVMKDPDSDWINVGCQRVQVHDDRTAGIMITQGRHNDLIMRRWWARGQSCPVAVSLGHHPMYLMLAGIPVPDGICEYDLIGGIRGEGVQVVRTPHSGLPVPCDSELVIDGEIPPEEMETHPEGPFGEFTGYYSAPERRLPVIKIKNILYRDNPVNLGVVPGRPPNDNTFFLNYLQSALVWSQMEKAGLPGIRGVWFHQAGGSKLWLTVAIQQHYPGHAKQAAMVAAACRGGSYMNRVTVVVDDDVDPTNTDDVIWAISTRTDPRQDAEVIQNCQSSPLDPMSYPADTRCYNSRLIIDACRPWDRRQSFPPIARASRELREKTMAKWGHLFDTQEGKQG